MASDIKTIVSKRSPYVPLAPITADKPEIFRSLEAALGSPFSTEPISPPPKPLIIVISGPSGVGKDAVIKKLRGVREGIHFVVTATSRAMRPGEVEGIDYYFVSKEHYIEIYTWEFCRFIFLVAENETALVERLVERKTETTETLLVRISTARQEVKHVKDFDYVVVNAEGKLDNAVKLVESIIDAEKAKVNQRNVRI
ncbi:hypothetical protein IFM89_019318 [Coptis chinensis]|uniref:Guanylate kinase-like domain-containing protein n=1 Tax=Coptis chinensis TaxID=261450 RepID=A0A835IBP8_9MAGN|nr:hypothetical protein IFM89_019318 [Coptis chinensis]